MKNPMKTPAPLRLLLLPALVCALAGTGELSTTTAVAHAASSQLHITHHATIANEPTNCPYGMAEMDSLLTMTTIGVICFNYTWGLLPTNILSVNSGNHLMKFIWKDWSGGFHTDEIQPNTIVEQGHGLTNGWAGKPTMDPQNINLETNAAPYDPGRTCLYGMAEMDSLDGEVGCFISHSPPKVLAVHIANTGSHSMGWNWKDCNGGSHTMGTKPPNYVLSVDNPPAPGCFPQMDQVYNISIS